MQEERRAMLSKYAPRRPQQVGTLLLHTGLAACCAEQLLQVVCSAEHLLQISHTFPRIVKLSR